MRTAISYQLEKCAKDRLILSYIVTGKAVFCVKEMEMGERGLVSNFSSVFAYLCCGS